MIKLPAYLTSFGSRADGSARLGFATQELTDDNFLDIKKHHNLFGWLLFSENDINLSDIPKEMAEEGQKSPSKRLRGALFAWWKQNNPNAEKDDFESYYRSYMNKQIEVIKNKLI